MVGPAVNGKDSAFAPSVSKNGTLYFNRLCKNPRGLKVMRSKLADGVHQEPEYLFKEIKTFHSFIAPDESFFILPLRNREDTIGSGTNWYVTFRDEKDNWSDFINLDKEINKKGTGGHVGFSPDGKYFFIEQKPEIDFIRSLEGISTYLNLKEIAINDPSKDRNDVFWVDAAIIEKLRPEGW